MTDRNLVAKKLAEIETLVQELRTLGRPEEIRSDYREQRFTERMLHISIEAVLDVASHIVSDERLGEPQTNRDLIDLLERYNWLSAELAARVQDMVGFRNVLVHGYSKVDLGIVEEVVRHHLDDLLDFVRAIRGRL